MDIRSQASSHDAKRVTVLVLQADTFEEERILTALLQAITKGGSITTTTPVDDENVRTVEFKFNQVQVKKRRKDG